MRIVLIDRQPFAEVRFLNAGKGPGSFYVDRLPLHLAEIAGLPCDLEAIVATADLQGREQLRQGQGDPPRLLGEVLPAVLCSSVLPSLGVAPERCGIVLAGDFYTVPGLDRRGGSGDVTAVWQAFAREFQWVVGVAGNHDIFGTSLHPQRRVASNAFYLDGDFVTFGNITVAGVGGIIGNRRKPQRKSEQEYASHLDQLLTRRPELVVLHDGPDGPHAGMRGSAFIRELVERHEPHLLVRGHAHWSEPMVELHNGTQVLNVDCRVVVMRAGRAKTPAEET